MKDFLIVSIFATSALCAAVSAGQHPLAPIASHHDTREAFDPPAGYLRSRPAPSTYADDRARVPRPDPAELTSID